MSSQQPENSEAAAIILAAGKGKRMKSDLPKVVHEVAGRPMVHWVVKACRDAGVKRVIVIVGHRAQDVRDALAQTPDVQFVTQAQQLGTGHAAMMAEPVLADAPNADVFVLAGDGPLIRAKTLQTVLQLHRDQQAQATLATAVITNPDGYGRVVRDDDGQFKAIVEQKDATPDQLQIREVNPSYYCFNCASMFASLRQVRNDNAQGEYYITDVPGLLKQQGKRVCVVDAVPPEDILSINNPEQLAEVDAILRRRLDMPQVSAAESQTAGGGAAT